MSFPQAGPNYSAGGENQFREIVARRDAENFKKGRDMELARGEQLILRSPDGSRWAISVSDAGVVSAVAL